MYFLRTVLGHYLGFAISLGMVGQRRQHFKLHQFLQTMMALVVEYHAVVDYPRPSCCSLLRQGRQVIDVDGLFHSQTVIMNQSKGETYLTWNKEQHNMIVLTNKKTVDGLHLQSCCKRWNPFIPFIERRAIYLYFLLCICCITHRTFLFDLIDDFWIVRISLINIRPIDFERLVKVDIYRGLVEVLSVDWLLVLRVFCFVYVVRMLRNGQKLALFVMICCLIADWK